MWKMWASKYNSDITGIYYMHFGSYRFVELHGLDNPIVEVELEENPKGTYFGFVEDGKLEGCLTWPSEVQFEMCFPYGSKVEEEKGRGKKIRLSIKEI